MRQLTEEELANAIRLDPGQFAGLGPSIDQMSRMVEDRKRQILEKYETDSVQSLAAAQFSDTASNISAPKQHRKALHRAVRDQQIYQLEHLWYEAERSDPRFASQLLHLMESLGEKYQIDHLASEYDFVGRESMTIPKALEILEELKSIDELLSQLKRPGKRLSWRLSTWMSFRNLLTRTRLKNWHSTNSRFRIT